MCIYVCIYIYMSISIHTYMYYSHMYMYIWGGTRKGTDGVSTKGVAAILFSVF